MLKDTSVDSRGFSLVETLVAAAILAGISLAFAQLSSNQSKAQREINRAAEISDLKRVISQLLLKPSTCSCNLSKTGTIGSTMPAGTLVFDSTVTTTPLPALTLPFISAGCLPLNGTTGDPLLLEAGKVVEGSRSLLKVNTIGVTDLKSTGIAGIWQGDIRVAFASTPGDMSRQDLTFKQYFNVDTTVPTAAFINNCASSQGGMAFVLSATGTTTSVPGTPPIIPINVRYYLPPHNVVTAGAAGHGFTCQDMQNDPVWKPAGYWILTLLCARFCKRDCVTNYDPTICQGPIPPASTAPEVFVGGFPSECGPDPTTGDVFNCYCMR